MEQMLRVHKFGGAVLRSVEGFRAMVQRLREEGERPLVVVVSALGQVTRQLEQLAHAAELGQEEVWAGVDALVAQHHGFAQQLLDERQYGEMAEWLEQTAQQLREYVEGVRLTGELTPRTLDLIRAFGERWALALTVAFLRGQGLPVSAVDATELICTDGRHGRAQPLVEETAQRIRQRLLPLLEPGRVVVTQGFVARSVQGELTTMGQESSALTAALIAALGGARELYLWTDVAGVYQCDPTLVPSAARVPQLSYEQAWQIASAGLRLLYPPMVEVARRWGLRVSIRSAFAPEAGQTWVSAEAGELPPCVVSRERVRLVCLREGEAVPWLHSVDGSTIFARWEEVGSAWVLISSDIPVAAAVEEGTLVTVLAASEPQVARLVQCCGQLQQEGVPVRLWYAGRLCCFVPEEHAARLVREFWRELVGCTKHQEAAS
jgi:aspartate kinase